MPLKGKRLSLRTQKKEEDGRVPRFGRLFSSGFFFSTIPLQALVKSPNHHFSPGAGTGCRFRINPRETAMAAGR
jgi:hypothetical protein